MPWSPRGKEQTIQWVSEVLGKMTEGIDTLRSGFRKKLRFEAVRLSCTEIVVALLVIPCGISRLFVDGRVAAI